MVSNKVFFQHVLFCLSLIFVMCQNALANTELVERYKTKLAQSYRLELDSVDAEDLKALGEALKDNKNIATRVLQISDSPLGLSIDALVNLLRANKNITTLSLIKNQLKEGIKDFAEALGTDTKILNLTLKDNDIGALGTKYIAEALKKNSRLRSLILIKENIGAPGAQYLAEVLPENKTLQSLQISDDDIDVEGSTRLADALRKSPRLSKLSLNGTKIGDDEGAQKFADALKHNMYLIKLVIPVYEETENTPKIKLEIDSSIAKNDRIKDAYTLLIILMPGLLDQKSAFYALPRDILLPLLEALLKESI